MPSDTSTTDDELDCSGCTRGSIGDYYRRAPYCPFHMNVADVRAVHELIQKEKIKLIDSVMALYSSPFLTHLKMLRADIKRGTGD